MKKLTNTLWTFLTDNSIVWVGASDAGKTNGDFHWIDETKVEDALWREGYPKNHRHGVDTCVTLEGTHKALTDAACDRKLIAVCKVPRKLICEWAQDEILTQKLYF